MFNRFLKSGLSKRPGIFGDRRIHLHLGAHKTATTYIQRILATNKDTLLENGVFYLPLAQTRAKLSKQIMGLSRKGRRSADLVSHRQAILDELSGKGLERCHTVLISDENLLGSPGRFKKGNVYETIPDDWKNKAAVKRYWPSFMTAIGKHHGHALSHRGGLEFRQQHGFQYPFCESGHLG